MWNEFAKKNIVKEKLNWCDVDFSYNNINGSTRTFALTISEKISEPANEDYDDYDSIWCTSNKNGDITGWFKIFKELKYTIDIKKDSYKSVARKIANEVAKTNGKQLYYDISSTVENEFGECPTLVKNQITKKYKPQN